MGVLIDTDVLIEVERGAVELDALVGDEESAISVITVSELLHGIHRAPDEATSTVRRAIVEGLLAEFDALPITEAVARVHAAVWAGLAERGHVIDAHDLWIAATALAHGAGVVTRNVHDFECVPSLRVVAAQA